MGQFRFKMQDFNEALAKNQGVKTYCRNLVNEKVEVEKVKMIEEFENHPVSAEIAAGPSASNISGTLGGYGNLFGFIGFTSNPIPQVVSFLKKFIKTKGRTSAARSSDSDFSVTVDVSVPTDADLASASPMPWEPGRSWVSAIAKGISGFSNFMNKAVASSRSGAGIQATKKIRGGTYSRTPYLAPILSKFKERLGR
jgi:hypothetical protein